MKKIVFICLVLITDVFFAKSVDPNEITIPKHYKIENTFSGDLVNNSSFHLIFAKNKKTKSFKVFSYLFDGNTIEELPSLKNDKSYGILSFHEENSFRYIAYIKKSKSFIIKTEIIK